MLKNNSYLQSVRLPHRTSAAPPLTIHPFSILHSQFPILISPLSILNSPFSIQKKFPPASQQTGTLNCIVFVYCLRCYGYSDGF